MLFTLMSGMITFAYSLESSHQLWGYRFFLSPVAKFSCDATLYRTLFRECSTREGRRYAYITDWWCSVITWEVSKIKDDATAWRIISLNFNYFLIEVLWCFLIKVYTPKFSYWLLANFCDVERVTKKIIMRCVGMIIINSDWITFFASGGAYTGVKRNSFMKMKRDKVVAFW